MGAGIAEVFARNGYAVIGVELNDDAVERGRKHLENSTGRAVEARQAQGGGPGRAAGPDLVLHLDQGPLRRRLRGRGGGGVAGDQEGDLRRAGGGRLARRDPGDQHVVTVGHRDLHGQRPPRPRRRRALLQPGSGAEPRRDRAHRGHRARRARRRTGADGEARQEPRRLRGQGRLHRQHAAVRLPQPRGLDVRGALRHPRGHRRRHALRLRLPDGSARAARPDRPRHGVRDPRDDVPPGPRPPARARAGPQADGHRRDARPEDRPRLLHLRGRRQLYGRAGRTHPVGRRPAAAAPRHQARRRRRHRHHGDRHRRGLRQERVRRPVRRPLAGQGRRRTRDHREVARQGDPARQARGVGQGRGPGPAHRHHFARRPEGRRHRGGGDRRGPASEDHAVREPRRDLQGRRDPRDHHVLAADHRAAPRRPRGRGTSSACTSSTRRRS